MTLADQQESGNRSRMMTIICIVLMLLLAFQVLRLVNQQQEQWDSSVFTLLERDFQVSVAHVYAEARLQGKVKKVHFSGRDVYVGRSGRPAVYNRLGQLDCAELWLQVMGFAVDSKATPIAIVSINRVADGKLSQGCRFIGSEDNFFDYFPEA